MPTSTDLEKKINLREAALRARAAETAAREAELQELKESLQKLQSARSDIRTAIEDAISDSPTINIEPTDWLEVAVEDFDSGPLTADEALRLALVSMRRQISSKDLVKWIIQSAVETSCLDAEGVIKAALETVRGTDLSVRDIVFVAMQAARNTPNISASEIVRPAVKISLELGNEIPVIIKDSFVAALRHNPSMLRSCLLSVLGCALGMGMTYRDIKDLMKAFSKEVKHGALDQRAADDPGKKVRFSLPGETQDPNASQPAQSQNLPSQNDTPGYRYTVQPSVVQAMVDVAVDSPDDNGPGQSVVGIPVPMLTQWPAEYVGAHEALQNNEGESSSAVVARESAKRSASDDGEEDAEISRPSKKRRQAELSFEE